MSAASEPSGSLAVAMNHAQHLLQSDPSAAAEQANEILRAVPGHPPALLLQAVARLQLGQLEAALELMEPLAAEQGPRSLRLPSGRLALPLAHPEQRPVEPRGRFDARAPDLDPAAAMVRAGSVIDEQYEIVRRVGRGAMGSVFEAYDRQLQRHASPRQLSRVRERASVERACR